MTSTRELLGPNTRAALDRLIAANQPAGDTIVLRIPAGTSLAGVEYIRTAFETELPHLKIEVIITRPSTPPTHP